MTESIILRRLSAAELDGHIQALSDILIDCVEGGASVSFMLPLSLEKVGAFWRGVRDSLARGEREVIVAELGGRAVGTVQLILAQPENQPHRADIAKMLVRRQARRKGLGEMLMKAAEEAARDHGKTLLVLDTASDDAERLYRRVGWIEVGRVPDYAYLPDGRPCDTIYFYKRLAPTPLCRPATTD